MYLILLFIVFARALHFEGISRFKTVEYTLWVNPAMVNQQTTRSKCLRVSIVHWDRAVSKWQVFKRTQLFTLDTSVQDSSGQSVLIICIRGLWWPKVWCQIWASSLKYITWKKWKIQNLIAVFSVMFSESGQKSKWLIWIVTSIQAIQNQVYSKACKCNSDVRIMIIASKRSDFLCVVFCYL